MLQDTVTQGVAILVVELFEVIDIQHHQGYAVVLVIQCLFK